MNREESNQQTPLSLLSNNVKSSRKPQVLSGGGDSRLKRDEWSEGAVSTLLEAYESKWILRNRAKLKGQDWEDVAKCVSVRGNSRKSVKTQTQCKNKIESMKKRYRSESASSASAKSEKSSWPLYPRLDLLLRGNAPSPSPQPPTSAAAVEPPLTSFEPPPPMLQLQPFQPPPPLPTMLVRDTPQNSNGSDAFDRLVKEDGKEVGNKLLDQEPKKIQIETDSSTPAIYSEKSKSKSNGFKTRAEKKKKQRTCGEIEIAESIRWLAEVIMRSEQARLETMKEVEKMRAETEAKRGEMDLKRTEIIANTQLEIAKLFAGIGKSVHSSL